jgi:hypothetical protein
VQGLGHVVGLRQGVDGRAVAGVHGVQRLDGQLHPGRGRMGQTGGDAVADLPA